MLSLVKNKSICLIIFRTCAGWNRKWSMPSLSKLWAEPGPEGKWLRCGSSFLMIKTGSSWETSRALWGKAISLPCLSPKGKPEGFVDGVVRSGSIPYGPSSLFCFHTPWLKSYSWVTLFVCTLNVFVTHYWCLLNIHLWVGWGLCFRKIYCVDLLVLRKPLGLSRSAWIKSHVWSMPTEQIYFDEIHG